MSKARFGRLCLCLAAVSGAARGQWTEIEEAKLVASDAAAGDQFGAWVALEGDTLVAGAPGADVGGLVDVGAAYVFVQSGLGWSEVQKLTPLVPAAGDGFGTAIAIDAGRILIGAPFRNTGGKVNAGAVEVFDWNGSSWVHSQELSAPSPKHKQRFGFSVALEGDTALCGAPSIEYPNNGWNPGSAFVLEENLGSWAHQALLSSMWPYLGGNGFGAAVTLQGDRAVIGTPSADVALIFLRSGTTWILEGTIDPRGLNPSGYNGTRYGHSVCMESDSVLVGAPGGFVPAYQYPTGNAQLHELDGGQWSWKAGFSKNTPIWSEEYGDSVALDGNLAAIGAPGGSHGLVYVQSRSGTTWEQIAKLKASDGTDGDRFGDTVALENERVFVGAPFHDQGRVYVYALVASAPQAYCTSGTSASGCTPMLATAGQASASAASGFVISAAGVEGGRTGMLIYGTAGKQTLPWGAGTSYLCLVPPLSYGGTLAGVGTHGNCDGSFAVDLNALWCPSCPKAATNPGESAAVQAQLWYRDPLSTSGQTTSLTDAVQLWVGP